jgi:hypothetical protein
MSRRHDLSNRLESYLTLVSPASPFGLKRLWWRLSHGGGEG